MKKFSKHYGFVMRVFLAFVFIWFGLSEIANPVYWSGYVPDIAISLPFYDRDLFIRTHGLILTLLGFSLIFRIYIRYVSLLAIVMMVQIIGGLLLKSGFELDEIVVRDLGILGLAVSIWLNENR